MSTPALRIPRSAAGGAGGDSVGSCDEAVVRKDKPSQETADRAGAMLLGLLDPKKPYSGVQSTKLSTAVGTKVNASLRKFEPTGVEVFEKTMYELHKADKTKLFETKFYWARRVGSKPGPPNNFIRSYSTDDTDTAAFKACTVMATVVSSIVVKIEDLRQEEGDLHENIQTHVDVQGRDSAGDEEKADAATSQAECEEALAATLVNLAAAELKLAENRAILAVANAAYKKEGQAAVRLAQAEERATRQARVAEGAKALLPVKRVPK